MILIFLRNKSIVFNADSTGGTQEQLSGLVHLEARHYSPEKAKFIQPDPYNLAELQLPAEARNLLVKQSEITLEDLLKDPAQQLDTSYVSGNPHKWVDPLGLWTFQVGIGFNGGFGVGYSASYGIAISYSSNSGFQAGTYSTIGIGGHGGINASGGIDVTVSSNNDIQGLSGQTQTTGGSAGFGIGVGYEQNMSLDPNISTTHTFSASYSVGTPMEVHTLKTHTYITTEYKAKSCSN